MMHTEEFVATLIEEPANGTRLAVENGHGDWKVIWRDDAEAKRCRSDHDTERWFDDADSDPMDLYQHLKYAQAVYVLGEPLAVFA